MFNYQENPLNHRGHLQEISDFANKLPSTGFLRRLNFIHFT